jgi:hypothetical protein
MNFRRFLLIFLSLSVSVGFGANLITINLDFSTVTLIPGNTVDFSGTITNLTNEYVYLNLLAVDGLPADFTVDTSPFLNGPYPLNPNQTSDNFTFFSVTSSSSYAGPFGVLPSTVTVLGDSSPFFENDFAENPIGETTVTLNVPLNVPTPEPTTLQLFAIGLLLVLPLAGYRHWRAVRGARRSRMIA